MASDTWTRAQLLRARGYPDEVVNGNGRPDTASPSVAAPPGETPEAVPAPTSSVCRQCAAPLEGPASKVWCSDRCRRRWRTEHEPARPSAPAKAATVDDGRAGQPSEASDVLQLLALLMQGGGWSEITVTLDQITVRVTRRP